ncbi:hypothetical protein M3690_04180 [Priestia megaterium]|nr:hypothetical protein [Priestia megaterium]MCM3792489.1 hypothetical protein [Priestia megaterium]
MPIKEKLPTSETKVISNIRRKAQKNMKENHSSYQDVLRIMKQVKDGE